MPTERNYIFITLGVGKIWSSTNNSRWSWYRCISINVLSSSLIGSYDSQRRRGHQMPGRISASDWSGSVCSRCVLPETFEVMRCRRQDTPPRALWTHTKSNNTNDPTHVLSCDWQEHWCVFCISRFTDWTAYEHWSTHRRRDTEFDTKCVRLELMLYLSFITLLIFIIKINIISNIKLSAQIALSNY